MSVRTCILDGLCQFDKIVFNGFNKLFVLFQIRTLGYSGKHPIFPVGESKAVLVVSNRLTMFDWMTKEQNNFCGHHVSKHSNVSKPVFKYSNTSNFIALCLSL